MSWFKRGRTESGKSRQSSDTASCNSDEVHEGRMRRDTDPATCLEVFRNHWEQAYKIISSRMEPDSGKSTLDEIDAVSSNFEQMVTLLAEEEGEGGQGMPGPILHYLLEHEILEKFCGWCHRNYDDTGKLIKEQLRMFEHLISQSHQVLLIHKPVIRPLLNLLAYCADGCCSEEIEPSLVLVLHQVCISISKETVILESFFNMNADHGPTKFLIFSLLIPYLHRDKALGQQARDALLLIMALSSKHPHIGKYIAENSDFCPVLATGLSGLYSDLPRKIEIPSEDWFRITDEEVAQIPEMSMFLNTLEFCNAVAQIAHPLVRDQLINFIYNGFLVPVLGPALHQDISGLPTPLLDSPMFVNSREEVITTTAYLDLFLRKVTEPSLIKAFLLFILTEKNDEIVILDSLITRINSSSKLCLVSLSLFHTLVDLNCEDVMFELVFKHLIPCTHVMVSQRRSVRDLDLYSKSAEKFLSLRPTCCLPDIGESPKHSTEPKIEPPVTAFPAGTFGSKLEHFETNYLDYLNDARTSLRKCGSACQAWVYPYDGEKPPATSLDHYLTDDLSARADSVLGDTNKQLEASQGELSEGKNRLTNEMEKDGSDKSKICDSSNSAINRDKEELIDEEEDVDIFHEAVSEIQDSRYDNMEDFISMLEESDSPVDKTLNIEDSMKVLDSLIVNISIPESRTSTPRKDISHDGLASSKAFTAFCDNKDISSVCVIENSGLDTNEKDSKVEGTTFEIIDATKNMGNDQDNMTEFEELDGPESRFDKTKSKCVLDTKNATEFVDISMPTSSGVQHHEQDSSNKAGDAKSDSNLSNNCTESFKSVENWFGESANTLDSNTTNMNTYPDGILVKKEPDKKDQINMESQEKKDSVGSLKGDKSVRFAAAASMQKPSEIIANPPAGVGISALKQGNESPTVGPLLLALLSKLDSMMQNSLPVNLVLTGLLARLATYPQPLLRSFLLNHNLVFQPTVKSLVQVLTSVRQKVDHYSYTVQNFEALLLRARRTLAQREGLLPDRAHSLTPSPEFIHSKLRSSTINEVPSKDKRHRTLADLLFKRSPGDKKTTLPPGKRGNNLELIPGNKGFRYINKRPEPPKPSQGESTKTRNAVYCAIVMEEFVKELAALSQEHAVLTVDDDGYSSC